MPHSERWTEQLLRELPDDPEDLLIPGCPGKTRNYADLGFHKLFYEWLDQLIYENPQSGLPWAKVAPQLALLAAEDKGPEERQAHIENVVMAYALLGGAYRAAGRPDAAEQQYRIAFGIVESETISLGVRVNLLRRFAYLRICQGRPEEAMDLLELEGLESLERLRTLLCRGYVLERLQRYSEAADCFGQVLEKINLKTKPRPSSAEIRVHSAAALNLANAVKELGPASCWAALGYVARAKKLTPHRPNLPLYQLQWIEGLIWGKLWEHGTPTGFSLAHEAEQALKRALHGFLHLRVPWEIALVSLDLAQLYRDLGRWDELLELSLETLQRFRILSGDTRAVVALGLIVDAVRAQENVKAGIIAAREVVKKRQQGARRQPPTRVSVQATAAPPPVGRSNLAMVQTRTKLLKAAYEEIEHGFKMRAILKRAGVNRTTFYHHFGDRQGCAIAVVDEHMHGMVSEWLQRVDTDDPLKILASLIEAEPPLVALPNGLATDRLEKLSRLWRRGLAEKLTLGQRKGTVRAEIDPDETAAYLIAGIRAQDPFCIRGTLQYLNMLRPPRLGGRRETTSTQA